MSSTVLVGAPTDTDPTYTVTISRDANDTVTDWTTATQVVLVLPDGSTKTVTKTSATAAQWVGTIKYTAWWATDGVYPTVARATFSDGGVMTLPDRLNFSVGRSPALGP
jgi:hypothetical protein